MGAACMAIAIFWNFHKMNVIEKIFKAIIYRKNVGATYIWFPWWLCQIGH